MSTKQLKIVCSLLSGLVLLPALWLLCAQTLEVEEGMLLDPLRSPDTASRQAAAQELTQRAHTNLERSLATLLDALRGQDADVRFYVAITFIAAAYTDATNATPLNAAVSLFIETLSDQDARVREAAAGALALVMPYPPPTATISLIELLDDPERKVRQAALDALGAIRPVVPAAMAAVVSVLREDASPSVRAKAANMLGDFRAADAAALEALIEALGDPDSFVRQVAVREGSGDPFHTCLRLPVSAATVLRLVRGAPIPPPPALQFGEMARVPSHRPNTLTVESHLTSVGCC